jgi:hypothetical protein
MLLTCAVTRQLQLHCSCVSSRTGGADANKHRTAYSTHVCMFMLFAVDAVVVVLALGVAVCIVASAAAVLLLVSCRN